MDQAKVLTHLKQRNYQKKGSGYLGTYCAGRVRKQVVWGQGKTCGAGKDNRPMSKRGGEAGGGISVGQQRASLGNERGLCGLGAPMQERTRRTRPERREPIAAVFRPTKGRVVLTGIHGTKNRRETSWPVPGSFFFQNSNKGASGEEETEAVPPSEPSKK